MIAGMGDDLNLYSHFTDSYSYYTSFIRQKQANWLNKR
jgi:hypothetical protein